MQHGDASMEHVPSSRDTLDVFLFQTGPRQYVRLSILETSAKKQLAKSNRAILDVSILGLIALLDGNLPRDKEYYIPSVILELIERSMEDPKIEEKYVDITLKLLRKWGWRKIKPHNVMHMFSKLIAMSREGFLKPITVSTIPEEYLPLYFQYKEIVYDKRFVIEFSPQVNVLGEIIGAMTAMSAAGIPILMTNLTYVRILAKYKLTKAIIYLSDIHAQKERFILRKAEKISHVDRRIIKGIKWIAGALPLITPKAGVISVILWLVDP